MLIEYVMLNTLSVLTVRDLYLYENNLSFVYCGRNVIKCYLKGLKN